jgi:hypothetical protein
VAVLTGPVYVPNPTPRTLRYGLFTVANGPLELPAHGADGGVQWLGASCGEALGYEVQCLDSLLEKGPFTEGLDIGGGDPFVVTAGFECAAVGLRPAERDALVLQKLEALEQAAVEQIFSEGTFGQTPSLANNTPAATDAGASSSITHAFMILEEAFYDSYGFPGTIHIPHIAAALTEGARIIEMRDGVWMTAAGSQVSFGNYSGLSPAGAAPAANTTWIYVTPPVTIWRDSDVFVAPLEGALDRTTNSVTIFAEREYVLAHDPCPVFATQATLLEGL